MPCKKTKPLRALPTSRVQEHFLPVPTALQPAIRHLLLLTVASKETEPVVRTLLPSFHIILLINLGPAADLWFATEGAIAPTQRLTSLLLAGPLVQPLHYRLPGGARVLVVDFTLAGFYRLFRVPAQQLRGAFIEPDMLVPGGIFAQLWYQLQGLATPAQLLDTLTAFCASYLRPLEGPHAALLTQLPQLAGRNYLSPLKSLAATSQLSERTLQLHFQKYLGFSAKELGRFLRFRRVLTTVQQDLQAPGRIDWLALLEQHGYYDQPHLIHEFTYFLRQSPSKVALDLLAGDTICVTTTELLS